MSSPESPQIDNEAWFRLTSGQSANPEDEERTNPAAPTAEQMQEASDWLERSWIEEGPIF